MRDEQELRRLEFRSGRRIRLADGQWWTFPGPDAWCGSDRGALLRGVLEAEDDFERLRAELALAIRLLRLNYELEPADYGRLLSFAPNHPDRIPVQQAFHELAIDHVRAFRGRCGLAEPVVCSSAGPWSRLRRLAFLLSRWGSRQEPEVKGGEPMHVGRPALTGGLENPGGPASVPGLGAF